MKETKIPLVWYILLIIGIIYTFIGFLSYNAEGGYEITHIPAWIRRIIDGSFVIIVVILGIKNKETSPFKQWFANSWIITYSLISLIIHYYGMLPPFYLYDRYPYFNKILHANASIILFFLIKIGFDKNNTMTSLFTLFIGILWEFLEYLTTPPDINYWTVIDIGYGWYDTKGDMIANLIGILIANLIDYINKITK